MKTAEEKIQFKNHFFKLGQGRIMTDDDIPFWLILLNTPSDASDIYDLLTPHDIRTVRDQNLSNFLLLIRIVSVNLVNCQASVTVSSRKHLLNNIRFLVKTLPFCFELPQYSSEIELPLFWDSKFDPRDFVVLGPTSKPPLPLENPIEHHDKAIAVELIHTLVNLLFVSGFTTTTSGGFWEPGIGSSAPYGTPDPEIDCDRTEVLRLLLVLCSSPYYQPPSKVIGEGSRFLTVLVSTLPKHLLINLLCSLINISCRAARFSDEENGLFYENELFKELRYFCVTYSIQLLCTMFVYMMPEDSSYLLLYGVLSHKPSNQVRNFFRKLTKESEVKFLASHFLNFLRAPIQSYREDAQRKLARLGFPSLWSLEALIILWELLQCNDTFRTSFCTRFIPRVVPYLVYHIYAFYDSPPHETLIKVMSYLLLYISSEQKWVAPMIALEPKMDGFPPELKMASSGSSRDSTVINICQILLTLASRTEQPPTRYSEFLLRTLVEILYNLIPSTNDSVQGTNMSSKGMNNTNPGGGLSARACSAVTKVIARFSHPSFLLQSSNHSELLALLIRALCAAATKSPSASRMILYAFLSNEKMYDHVWNVIHSLEDAKTADDHLNEVSEVDEEQIAESEEEPIKSAENGNVYSTKSSTQSTDEVSAETPADSQESIETDIVRTKEEEAKRREKEQEVLVKEETELADALRPYALTGMSEKFKEKLPMGAPLYRTWGGTDALKVIITIIIPQLKLALKDVWGKRHDCNYDNFFIVKQIEHSSIKDALVGEKDKINFDLQPNEPLEILRFFWNPLSIGWYTAQMCRNIFDTPEHVKAVINGNKNIIKNISSTIKLFGKLASAWSGLGGQSPVNELNKETIDYLEANFSRINPWESTTPRLFAAPHESNWGFNPFISRFGQGQNAAMADLTNSLARKLSDFKLGGRSSVSSQGRENSYEDHERYKLSKRNSVSSLHSLNTLNRTRSNTPRNSLSL